MGRRYITIEMGDHAYTHCKVRLDKVIAGEDKGGITKSAKWESGGGYRFYVLAPTLINQDAFGEYVINPDYDADMLAAGVALHEGLTYQPDKELFWKQSVGNENSYLFVTTRHLNSAYLDSIKDTMEEDEYLIIACRSFDSGLDKAYKHITVKKIPQMLLNRCEFGKNDYTHWCMTMRRTAMNNQFPRYTTDYISGVMSLRKPQKQSLIILEEIVTHVPLRKGMDLKAALDTVLPNLLRF